MYKYIDLPRFLTWKIVFTSTCIRLWLMFIKLWYEFTKMLFNKLTLLYPWCLMANEENYSWSEIKSSYELRPCVCDFILVEEYYYWSE